jgi:hypothetical protein
MSFDVIILLMTTQEIVAALIAQRDRLTRAIEVLQGPTKRIGRPPKDLSPASTVAPVPTSNGHRSGMTPAARKAQSKRMKAYWAAKRKEMGKKG